MTAADLPPELLQRAKETQRRCAFLAGQFSKAAAKRQRIQGAITVFSNLVGIATLVVTFYFPDVLVGTTDAVKAAGAISAIVLIVVPYLQMAVLRDPPTRFQDYAFYIGGFAHGIAEIISDVKSTRRYERLIEVLALADKNLNDVRVKWPNISASFDGKP